MAGGNLNILLLQRAHHIGCREIARGQAHRIEPYAHGVLALAEDHHIAHAGHALERVFHIDIQIVGDVFAGVAAVERIESRAEDEVVGGLYDVDAGGDNFAGQAPFHAGHAVLHVHGRDVEVVAGLKGDVDFAGAAVGAGGADVAHALHAVDRLFQRNGDGFFDGFRIGAHVIGRYRYHRRRQRRVHGHRKIGNADGAAENDHQGADRGKYRPVNKEIDKQSKSLSL